MKRIILFFAALAVFGVVSAQSEVMPPKYKGATAQRYMAHLKGEVEKLAVERNVPPGSLSEKVAVKLLIEKDGSVSNVAFLDNTSQGRDTCDLAPATEPTRELVTQAVKNLGAWDPAEREGQPIPYTMRLTVYMPVKSVAKQLDKEPLQFMGGDPDETFHPWAEVRVRFDERFTSKGIEGVVHVKFYIEPDGKITDIEVLKAPDKKLSDEVVRVIKNSKGKWTPKRVDGIAQRSEYTYRVNYLNN